MTKRTLFFIGLILELIAIFGLFVPYAVRLQTGEEALLRTVPVDPWSLLRGEYVVLDYAVGQDLPTPVDFTGYGEPVYVVLSKQGDTYERVKFSDEKPMLEPGQLCLKGRKEYNRAVFPDLAQYFVEQGLGREIENVQRSHRLLVTAVIDSDTCTGIIKDLRLGPEVPDSELPEWMRPVPIEDVPVREAPPVR
ncbi:GDYXXLXY domain-containing protein [Candidatus Peregrinibacteria bacterium]|nr:GDYXXLXY domain-containing protein [Candidatus Peregrinibacteria bacterium]